MGLSKGERPAQEDALHLWFEPDTRSGYIIIADGMGGHTSGDIASSLVVEAVDVALTDLWAQKSDLDRTLRKHLPKLVETANKRLANYIKTDPDTQGMGTTLIVAVILDGNLYWASIGDSPLYIWRDGRLKQLNEDHSMARQIDQMVQAGQLTQKAANEHPHRTALTSVLMGTKVADMDCTVKPLMLKKGDVLIASTDGVRSISSNALTECIQDTSKTAQKMVASITKRIDATKSPTQDNLAICVAKIL